MHAFVKRGTECGKRSAAIGAALLLAAGCGQKPAARPSAPTFDKDIAPIVFANCAPCHRPGQVAPFSLLTYADVVKHADNVVRETSKRHMPPWLPDPGDFPIIGERRLRQDQIDLFRRWLDGGMKEGDAADLPRRPEWRDAWQLGTPDAVLTAPKPFVLKPGTEDVYRNLILHSSYQSVMYVQAVEFSTGGAPIHHAVVRVDRTGGSRARDSKDGQPGFDGMAWENVQDPDGQFIGWAPGRGPIESPRGMPWRLDPGADLVVELHMLPVKKAAVIQPAIALYLTETPPADTPVTVTMSTKTIDIPAGKADYTITDTYELPVSVDLLSVYPHAHYLGKDMLVTATMADGSTKRLLHIPQWSFHWQQDYRYVTPIPLAAGTRITMKYTYDNSNGNEDNPHKPPVRVQLGPKSTDEMSQLGLQLLTKSRADAARLVHDFDERDILANIALGEMRVRDAPGSADDRAFLGGSYLDAERYADALPHLEAAVRLNPRLATAHADLGTVLLAQGNRGAALDHLRRAASLAPRDAKIVFNLGNALSVPSPAAAASQYARALEINPSFADAHVNLGNLLFRQGRLAEALPHFARGAALQPGSAVVLTDYGSALAAAGRYGEALVQIRAALALNPDYVPARDDLHHLEQLGVR
ncbi:MAG TPA: tetratricopeptide repeat protein [Vicinamibacterales bacterium]|nr:tetratricopeptide repeat protein [Vicinamibacterales bacterium]